MARFDGLRRLFRLDRPADVERAVDDELRFHFDMKVRELMDHGLDERAARQEAERRFGDVQRTREGLAAIDRDAVGARRRGEWWSGLLQDLRYALRGLRLKPGFALGVIVTLGLGIGANATMFGIVDRLMLRPPAFLPDAASVHRLYFVRTVDGTERAIPNTSYRTYLEMQRDTRSFSILAGFFNTQLAVGTGEDAREEEMQLVSASYWSLFDARPVVGRFFGAEEDSVVNPARVAVLSWGYWQRQFGGDRNVAGRTLRIGERDYRIIGVAPRGFQGMSLQQPVAFIPITAGAIELGGFQNPADLATSHGFRWMEIFARRRGAVTTADATADLTHAYQLSYAHQAEEWRSLPPAREARPHALAAPVLKDRGPNQGDDSKVATWLIGVAAIVLIIACANVGNLLLARAFGRRREIAVRLALGISRARLLRQLLTESVLLAALGGATGVVIAQVGGGILRATLLPDVEWDSMLADPRVLGFALLAALGAGLLTGLAPALHAVRSDVAASLKAGVREGTFHRSRMRTLLLVLQGALSVVLLVGAGLFVRSLHNVRTMRLGFDADRVLYVSPQMRGVELPGPEARLLRERLLAHAARLPIVENASRQLSVPFWMTFNRSLFVAGIDSVSRLGEFELQAGSTDYFATMGTRILRGRGIIGDDRDGAPGAMVVSESMARALWPGKEALGQCVRLGADTLPCFTVVGVAENIWTGSLRENPAMTYYLSSAQYQSQRGGLFVRTRDDASRHREEIRRELQGLMPGDAYVVVQPLESVLQPEMRSFALGATMFTIFGALALVVAAVGLYSVVAYGVAQRGHELGVRVALGAQAGDLVRLVLGEGVRMALIAVVLGLLAALGASRWIAPLLFGISPRDPLVLSFVAATLLAIAVTASLVPALRASRVDPNRALRDE